MESKQNGSGRFGRIAQHQASVQSNITPSQMKTDVIIVCSPTRMTDKESCFWNVETDSPTTIIHNTPVTQRISHLLKTVNADQSLQDIFSQTSGVPVSIAARVGTKECDAKIVQYTVNKSCANMHSMFSQALASSATTGTLERTMNECGVFAIICVDATKSVKLIHVLENDLANSVDTLIPFVKAPDETLLELTVNEQQLPANPLIVYSGTRASFIITNGRGDMYVTASEETKMEFNKEQAFEQAVGQAMELGIPTAGRQLEDILADIAAASSQEDFSVEDAQDEGVSNEEYAEHVLATVTSFGFPRHTLRALAQSYELPVTKAMEKDAIKALLLEYFIEKESDLLDVLTDLAPLAKARDQDIGTLQLTIEQLKDQAEDELVEVDEEDEDYHDEEDGDVEVEIDLSAENEESALFVEDALSLTPAERIEQLQAAGISTAGLNIVQIIRKYNEVRANLNTAPVLGEEEAEEDADETSVAESFDNLAEETREAIYSYLEIENEADPTEAAIAALRPSSIIELCQVFGIDSTEIVQGLTDEAFETEGDNDEAWADLDTAIVNFIEALYAMEDDSEDVEDEEDDEESEAAESPLLDVLESLEVEKLRGLSEYFDIEDVDVDTEAEEMLYLVDSIVEQVNEETLTQIIEDLGLQEEVSLSENLEAMAQLEVNSDEYSEALYEFAALVFETIEENADSELETEFDDTAVITEERNSPMGQLLRVKSNGAAIINFVLVNDEEFSAENVEQMSNVNGVNYRFPFYLGEDGLVGSMHAPANVLLRSIAESTQPMILANRSEFNARSFARRLSDMINNDIQARLYEGQLEEDLDPTVFGIQLGDFDDEETEGTMIPMADLYDAKSFTRVLNDQATSQLLTAGVLNIMVPGFWFIKNGDQVSAMIQKAVNTVQSSLADRTNLEIHAAFTFNIGDVMQSDYLFNALTALREMENATIFTATDASAVDTTSDVLAYLASLDRDNLPMTVLSSGAGSYFFEQGGDTSIVIPCFDLDEDDEDEDDLNEYEEDEEDIIEESDDETEEDSDDSEEEDEEETEEDSDDSDDEEDEEETEEEEEEETSTPETSEALIELIDEGNFDVNLELMPRAEMRKAVVALSLATVKDAKTMKGRQLVALLEDFINSDEDDLVEE